MATMKLEIVTAERQFNRFVIGLAATLSVDGLLLVPVLIVVDSRPDLLWQALAPYVAATLVVLAAAGILMRRRGILTARGPWMPWLLKLLGLIALIITGLAVGVLLAPPIFLLLVLGYLWAIGYVFYATLKWQALYLQVQCIQCGATTSVSVAAWLTSPADGERRRIACGGCGIETWGTIASQERRLA